MHRRLLLYACVGLVTWSEATVVAAADRGGIGYVGFGYQQFTLAAVNDALSTAGFAGFEPWQASFGGGGIARVGAWLLGGEGAGWLGDRVANADGREASLGGGYGLFQIGYTVWRIGAFSLTPVLGVGAGAVGLTIQDPETPTLADALGRRNPGFDRVEYGASGFLLRPSLRLDLAPEVRKADAPGGRALADFSLVVGWLWTPGWRLDDPGATELSPQGITVMLQIGFGGRHVERGTGSAPERKSKPSNRPRTPKRTQKQ